jgi:nanoRNase/pAp phosphatase (c-di-AMP/oligoRNAs hydrolase)
MEGVLIMSLRSSSRKQQAGGILRKLVGHSGSAGGHREMAGGIIPVLGMKKEEIQELENKIIEKFLVLINRKKQIPRKLVHSQQYR